MTDPEQTAVNPSDLDASSRGLVEKHVFEAAVVKTRMAMALADPNLPDCPLVYINPAFTDLTGYGPAEAVGRNCRFLQGPQTDRETVRRLREAVVNRESISEEIYNYRRDGSGFWNALCISPVFDEDGKLIYIFGSQVDISARKETTRRQAQRIESMGALAAGVAHEFNNLMTVVLGSLERTAARVADEAQKRNLERAELSARRAGQLASELLTLAQRRAGDERTVDLNDLVRDAVSTLGQALPQGMEVRVDLTPTPLLVRLDPGQLELVLHNLIRNAADAMPRGGQVGVATRALTAPEAVVALNGREAVELAVTDTGQGMTPEVAQRATELFFTTKGAGKGTGLGLFLALEFVDKSGGRLTIDSQAGQGTKVRLVLPRASEP